ALATKAGRRIDGLRERRHAVVHHAPDVAKQQIVSIGDLVQTAWKMRRRDRRLGRLIVHQTPLKRRGAPVKPQRGHRSIALTGCRSRAPLPRQESAAARAMLPRYGLSSWPI